MQSAIPIDKELEMDGLRKRNERQNQYLRQK
jgi:hypothetical protein